nr:acyl-CoA thioesterase domain-containing protein [Planosporangium mesophilum]
MVPAPHARGPWAANMLHGRLLGGLLARAVEREHTEPSLHVTRLTVDLFRNTPLVPVRVETTRVRDGRRIRVVDATVLTADGPVARASAVLLRRSEQPAGEVPTTPAWDARNPDQLGPSPWANGSGWRTPWDTWLLDDDGVPTDRWLNTARRRVWLRETHELVAGEPISPLVRVALAGDFASPLAHFGDAGLQFINGDYTLTLSRLPLSDAIGVESDGHLSDDGIAVGHCIMHDTSGPIGYCAVTAVANPNSLTGRS